MPMPLRCFYVWFYVWLHGCLNVIVHLSEYVIIHLISFGGGCCNRFWRAWLN